MPETPEHIADLNRRRDELKQRLAEIGDMRPGSLTGRYRKCGKPTCHCAQPGSRGHGPSWSLTRHVQGKTVTKIIPATAVEQAQEQLAEYQRFRALNRELVEVSVRLCDAQLSAPAKASPTEVEKRGSRAPWRKRSPKRSRSF